MVVWVIIRGDFLFCDRNYDQDNRSEDIIEVIATNPHKVCQAIKI